VLPHNRKTTTRATSYPQEDRRKTGAPVYYPRMQGPLTGQIVHKRTILLVVPDPGVGTHLAHLLQADDYAVFTVAGTAPALTLLAIHPIALILIHYTTQIGATAWESYCNLRQHTTKPVIMINDLTATHFTQIALQNPQEQYPQEQYPQEQCDRARQEYRRFINLLWATVVGTE
jgi:hypothetical protein